MLEDSGSDEQGIPFCGVSNPGVLEIMQTSYLKITADSHPLPSIQGRRQERRRG